MSPNEWFAAADARVLTGPDCFAGRAEDSRAGAPAVAARRGGAQNAWAATGSPERGRARGKGHPPAQPVGRADSQRRGCSLELCKHGWRRCRPLSWNVGLTSQRRASGGEPKRLGSGQRVCSVRKKAVRPLAASGKPADLKQVACEM